MRHSSRVSPFAFLLLSGIIFAVGQGALSLGYSIGQVASGSFIELCQVGVSLVGIKRCMIGLRVFAWINAPLHRLESSFIATCICNTSPRNQRDSVEQDAAAAAAVAVNPPPADVADASNLDVAAAEAAVPVVADVAAPENGMQHPSSPRPEYMRSPRRAILRSSGLPASFEQV